MGSSPDGEADGDSGTIEASVWGSTRGYIMFWRTLVITALVILVLACAAVPALAYAPLIGHLVPTGSKLAPGADPAVVVWAHDDGGGSFSLLAQRYENDGTLHVARTVASGITGLDGWHASGHGSNVTVAWKAGGAVHASCIDVTTGTPVFGPVTVCTDAAVAALDGAATTAALSGVTPDGHGGAYVWCTVSPTRGVTGFGDTVLNHLSASGALAIAADPGLAVAKGTIAGIDADDEGHAFVLLAPPGRNGLAAQRFSPSLAADPGWSRPISPYSPLLPVPAATQQLIGIDAASGATIAWRENGKVKIQRYPTGGGLIWQLAPPTVTMAGDVRLAADGFGGAYLVGPATGGIVARHILSTGVAAAPASVLPGLGLGQPRVDALTVNRAGDLFAAYSDAAAPALAPSGIGLLTYLGAWSAVGPPTMRPDLYTAAVPDGTGGAYLLGDGTSSAVMWRIANGGATAAVTFRPRSVLVEYGKTVLVAGYATRDDSLPASGVRVTVGATSGGGSSPGPKTTEGDGYYHASVAPKANATWTASAVGVASEGVVIRVRPRVTLALSHLKPQGTRLREIFSGAVTPSHAGAKVLIQKAVGAAWRTVASGRLDGSSHYRVVWAVPFKTASYKLRAMLPAHADHAEGDSSTAGLKVVIKKAS